MILQQRTIASAVFFLNNGALAVPIAAGITVASFARNGAGAYTFDLDPDNLVANTTVAGSIIYYPDAAEVVIARLQGVTATNGRFRLFFTDPGTGALTEVTGNAAVQLSVLQRL